MVEKKMINYFITIGIEVHAVVSTKSKMFSPSANSKNSNPNTEINEIDLGLPGTMPSVNEDVIKKAIVLAKFFNMEIDKNIRFDRKNYFYQDLPKGFQITQQFFPIGKNGYIDIKLNNKTQRIEIERIHLEEDTAKQNKINNEIFLDYNRAGLPLIEIVTKPTIHSIEEASAFLRTLRQALQFNSISDGKMEDGSMRADINISIAPIGSKKLGTRIEIKNINSINNVEKAIEFEANRQYKLIVANKKFINETRRFDDVKNTTEFMREKVSDLDYRYMTEPNILNINIDDKFIQESLDTYSLDFRKIENDLSHDGLDDVMISHLINDYDLFKVFNKINKKCNDSKEVYKWLCIELLGQISKKETKTENIPNIWIDNIIELIQKLKTEEINAKQAKELVKHFVETNKKISELINELNFVQINDPEIISEILDKYIKENQNMIDQYDERPERVEKFFIGMVMKETNGQANPNVCLEIFKNKIKK
ncbi:MAG: Asp-tRNA(Asn)/Glu-tRNA(Gln) amidotransferase subunit GatB [Mycoplasmoidaceae bacterium]